MKTVAVRVPDEWKARMAQEDVRWSEVLRDAIRRKLEHLDRARLLESFVADDGGAPGAAPGAAARSVREDRDAR